MESAAIVRETPVTSFGALSRECGGDIVLKLESMQRTGSFKLRGALSKLRSSRQAASRGVVAGSAGNHGQALAYAARHFQVPCTVFMPARAALSKVEAVSAFGAMVRQLDASVDECVTAAKDFAAEEDLLFVHPFDDQDLIAGQAGVGLELYEQVPDLAKVVVPVGGGGLIGGTALALKQLRPEIEIVGVQASGCTTFEPSLAAGRPITVPTPSTIADGIAIKRPGEIALSLAEEWVDGFASVTDDAITDAMVLLVERAKLVTEGAGAAPVAAMLSGAVPPARHGKTVLVLSGGNVDAHLLAAVINRHLTSIGRRFRLWTRISDRPGGLADLLAAVAGSGGNVLDLFHVRDGVELRVDETAVELLIESRSERHREEILSKLRARGFQVNPFVLSRRSTPDASS
jgi:threonine dehydratase